MSKFLQWNSLDRKWAPSPPLQKFSENSSIFEKTAFPKTCTIFTLRVVLISFPWIIIVFGIENWQKILLLISAWWVEWIVFVRPNWLLLAGMGGSICKIYLFTFWTLFVYIVKCIWPNLLVGQKFRLQIYLFQYWNVFVHIKKCIWFNWLFLAGMGGSVGQMSALAVSSFAGLRVKSQTHPNPDQCTVFCFAICILYLHG